MSDQIYQSVKHKDVSVVAGSSAYCIAISKEHIKDQTSLNNALVDIEGRLMRVANSVYMPEQSNEYFSVFGVVAEPGHIIIS